MERERLEKCLKTLNVDISWVDALESAFQRYEFSDEDIKVFIAQTTHESSNYKRLEESFNYKPERLYAIFKKYIKSIDEAKALLAQGPEAVANRVYGGRMGNLPDEGYRYRGRGIIQLTGKDNYAHFGFKIGVELVREPDLAKEKNNSILVACEYYKERGCIGKDIDKTTFIINGGMNGIEDRKDRYNKIKNI